MHRVAASHAKKLVGRIFRASSPNGRFTVGAKAIDGRRFERIEAVGKNLFAWFGGRKADGRDAVVVHVHFGMSGRWGVFDRKGAPEPTPTTRLRLEDDGLVSHVSAMTVQHGGHDLYTSKRSKLGHDGLRTDADPDELWAKVAASRKCVGKLLMDQSFFAGVGNIYRAEILFKAGVHPNILGTALSRAEFDRIWTHTVKLLQRGFMCGSILTVDPDEAIRLGRPRMRRYIYNQSKCGRCSGPVRSWSMASRTCYACPSCQPLDSTRSDEGGAKAANAGPVKVFNSHCAGESLVERLLQPKKLRVAELRAELELRGLSRVGRKAILVARLLDSVWACGGCGQRNPYLAQVCAVCGTSASKARAKTEPELAEVAALPMPGTDGIPAIRSARAAVADKVSAGEKLNVEHVADLDMTGTGRSTEWTNVGSKAKRLKRRTGPVKQEFASSDPIAVSFGARQVKRRRRVVQKKSKTGKAKARASRNRRTKGKAVAVVS